MTKTKKPANGIAKFIVHLSFAVLGLALHAVEIAVPAPDEMLSEADVVAVATISKNEGAWSLVLKEVLKGTFRRDDKVTLSSPYGEEAFSFDHLARLVGDGDFLFVGKQHGSNNTLQPIYGLCSFWPQGTVKELLPERTLTDAVARARKTLGLAVQTPPGSGNNSALPSQSKPVLEEKGRPAENLPSSAQPATPKAPEAKPAPPSPPSAASKAPEAKPAPPSPGDEPTSSTRWLAAAVVVAALALLWLLLKKRK